MKLNDLDQVADLRHRRMMLVTQLAVLKAGARHSGRLVVTVAATDCHRPQRLSETSDGVASPAPEHHELRCGPIYDDSGMHEAVRYAVIRELESRIAFIERVLGELGVEV